MGASALQTANLELVPHTRDNVARMIEAMTPYEKAQLSADWLLRFRATSATDPWVHGFKAVHRESGVGVGTGGFKGPPADGMVEIAYGVDTDYRGKGYATEIAAALVSYALAFAEVDVVRAHTLPDAKASQRVLSKCRFQRVGEVTDPDDGLVWRFEKRRDERSPQGGVA